MAMTLTIGGVDRTAYIHWDSLKIEQAGGAFTAVLSFRLNDAASALVINPMDAVEVDDNGTILFTGEVVDHDDDLLSLALPGQRLTVVCRDNNALVDEAVIDTLEEYAAEDDSDIIDDLFTKYRADINSVMYVATIGALTISFENVTLRQALDSICERTGGRWYVDEALNLHYFETEANVAAWYLTDDAPDLVTSFPFHYIKRRVSGAIVNQLFVVGQEISDWFEDAASVAAYGPRPGPPLVDTRITTAAGLQERAEAALGISAYPRVSYDVVISHAGLRAGMDVRLECVAWGVDVTLTVVRQTIYWQGGQRFHRLEMGDGIANAVTAGRAWISQIATISNTVINVNNEVFDTDAPPTPTFVLANVITAVDTQDDGTQVVYFQVTWGASSADDLDHYELQMSRSNDFSGHVVTRNHPADGDRIERFEAVLAATDHYFRVRAVDWVGNYSAWSSTITKTAAADTTPPAAPANVTALATPISVHLTWDANSEADLAGYDIQRKLDGGVYATINQGFRSTLLIDNNVTAGASYWYKVRAVDTSGNASAYTEIGAAVTVVQISPINIAGAHGIAIADIVALMPFDGPRPYPQNFVVETVANHGQVATVTGGIIGRPGLFGKALQVGQALSNLVANPFFTNDTSGWLVFGTNTIARSSEQAYIGGYSGKITYQDNQELVRYALTPTAVQHYLTAWIWVPSNWDGGNIYLVTNGFTGCSQSSVRVWTAGSDPTGEWFKVISEVTPLAGDLTGNAYFYTSSAPTVGRYFYFDAVQVEASTYPTPSHNATTRTAAGLTYLVADLGLKFTAGSQGTVAGWAKMDIWDKHGAGTDAFLLYAAVDADNVLAIYWDSTTQLLTLRWEGATNNDTETTDPSGWDILSWHHFAITWNFSGSNLDVAFYVDGELLSSVSDATPMASQPTNFEVGWDGTDDQLNGLIDDLFVADRALGSTEIQVVYESGAPVQDASQAYWMSEWQGWGHNLEFSATDNDTVEWTSGTITLRNGITYSIGAGNTGNMAATTYVYLDRDVSETALQTTTTAASAVGPNRLMLAVCANVAAGKNATFEVFGGAGNLGLITADEIAANTITAGEIFAGTITANEIAANTITANEIAANTITAAQIAANTITAAQIAAATITATELNVATLSAISADLGTITAGTVTGATIRTAAAGARVVMDTTSFRGYSAAAQTFEINLSTGTGFLGTSSGITWTAAGVLTCAAMYAGGGNSYIGTTGIFFATGATETNGIVWKASVPSGNTKGYIRVGSSDELDIVGGGASETYYPSIYIRQQKSGGGSRTPIRIAPTDAGNTIRRRMGLYSEGDPTATVHIVNPVSGSGGEDIPVLKLEQDYTGGSNQPVIYMDQNGGERILMEIYGEEDSAGSPNTDATIIVSSKAHTTWKYQAKMKINGVLCWINAYT